MLNRKVRFNLPRPEENDGGGPYPVATQNDQPPHFDFFTISELASAVEFGWDSNQGKSPHSTKQYVNGMLVNRNTQAAAPVPKLSPGPDKKKIDIHLQCNVPKSDEHQIKKSTSLAEVKEKSVINESPKFPHKLTQIKSLPAINNLTEKQKAEKVNRSRSGLFSGRTNRTTENLKNGVGVTALKPNEIKLNPPVDYNMPKKPPRTRVKATTATNQSNTSVKPVPLTKSTSVFNFNLKNRPTKPKTTPPVIQHDDLSKTTTTTSGNNNKFKNNYIHRYKSSGQFLTVPDLDDDDIFENFSNPYLMTTMSRTANAELKEAEVRNQNQLWNLFERWRKTRHGDGNKNLINATNLNNLSSLVCFRPEEKRSILVPPYRSYKMSLEKLPVVTTLLRASREANESLLKECLAEIKANGITKEELNSSDLTGRTAFSYICSTNLTSVLDEMLKISGIDVNKVDNEGNTPLHFAAQAGVHEIVNMILTRSRSVKVDAKNNFGFTPLMKAALQGRTKCAKLLLFAGANPAETDPGRNFSSDQWARLCGRYSCAEMIEKYARTRLLEKTTSCSWSHDTKGTIDSKSPLCRSKTNPSSPNQSPHLVSRSESFRNKFLKILPFSNLGHGKNKSSSPSKNSPTNMDCSTNLVTYLTAAALCASGPALPSNGNVKIIKSLLRPLEVPKLKVTPENNQKQKL